MLFEGLAIEKIVVFSCACLAAVFILGVNVGQTHQQRLDEADRILSIATTISELTVNMTHFTREVATQRARLSALFSANVICDDVPIDPSTLERLGPLPEPGHENYFASAARLLRKNEDAAAADPGARPKDDDNVASATLTSVATLAKLVESKRPKERDFMLEAMTRFDKHATAAAQQGCPYFGHCIDDRVDMDAFMRVIKAHGWHVDRFLHKRQLEQVENCWTQVEKPLRSEPYKDWRPEAYKHSSPCYMFSLEPFDDE